jgi:alkylation response protein AidB-like acyl-CoA dehydrogenase
LYDEAQANGSLDDPVVADALAQSYIDLQVLRLHNLRTLTRLGRGEEPGPESSWVKLMWTTMTQRLSETGLAVTGRDPTSSLAGPWPRQWLWSRAASIAGGTSEIQRDIIAGRILRLPR